MELTVTPLTRFLGDTPWRVLIKLLLVSLVVGYLMHLFNWTPVDMFYSLRNALLDIWHRGFAAFGSFMGYILLGAAVVVPIFLIARVLSYQRN